MSTPPPSLTPIYLGNATVTGTGDFALGSTIMKTNRYPVDAHELVPRAYVDNYFNKVTTYYDGILDPNSGRLSLLDRVSILEAELQRVYKALWNSDRTVSQIVTGAGVLTVDAALAASEAAAATLIAGKPVAPVVADLASSGFA